jgi:2-oxoglutarate dehydrogenase E2 component (dihydrolipoamide succinyltransferase)
MSSIIQVKVPVLPESVQDATIAAWHKKPGDTVKRDENLVDLETDKVVLEVPAPTDGVLTEVLKAEGAIVNAEELLATIVSGAVADNNLSDSSKKAQDKPQEEKVTQQNKPSDQVNKSAVAHDLSPSARRAAAVTGANVNAISGSGKDGRVTKLDVLHGHQMQDDAIQVRPEKRVPMTRLRAKIADRLVQSQQTAAILTTFNEINMQPVMDIRARYKDEFEKVHGVKLGFMSFFIKAVVESLKRSPDVNASIDGTDIVYHGYFDIGVAVSSDRGLVVPIIRDADRKSMAEIEAEIRDFGVRAQKGQLSLEEMTGGTFTVSNGGVFGSLLSTPIINPPQSGILGMHKIEERPIVENKQIVIRPMMYVALSYDHRIIDGKESVTFLRTVKELLEDPTRLLLDV